ncbi:MAG: aminotransferase class III-fold pyridoxal phosphate-dependent enzyme [Spirochaetales bacterium]|uniref:Aminotransferase class III-fold pyridoxal phosphate-dependent enzyme n=1 Tax=Candidatus Thalassospirochaeta sargassi TaxID=3119039 RepID=A0AAJ1IDI5_9SPIO|nr:aminotransferase class III-fold pyridoxal phosphate-dependent enzyme [Spirochaetales bacterium]
MNSDMNGISSVWTHATDIMVDHAEGCWFYGKSGDKYLDFTSGIGVTNTGHCHPKVVEAIKKQSEKLIFGQFNIVYHEPIVDLVNELKSVMPDGLDTFFFASSGAEAVEAAVKLAKHATGRPNVIVFNGSFHGRSHLTMAMTTSKTVYREGYQPLPGGIFVSPYPYSFYYGWDDDTTKAFAIKELKRTLSGQSQPDETAAIIIEPVLGEGGYVVPPAGFLQAVREICDEYGIMMIADEVQSGFCRTGKFFAVQHEDIKPDIMTMAKGLGSGMPISGIAYKKQLQKKWRTGTHGGTYSGNTMGCAAAAATVRVMKEEKLDENAAARGGQLMNRLKQLQAEYPVIGDVRGRGCMVATEFIKDGQPDSATSKAVIAAAREENMLMLGCGTYGNIIRWIPPLVISEDEMNDGLTRFENALKKVLG